MSTNMARRRVTLPADVYAAVATMAAADYRTTTQEIVHLLRCAVALAAAAPGTPAQRAARERLDVALLAAPRPPRPPQPRPGEAAR